MKLTARLDLGPLKAAATDRVNHHFARRAAALSPVPALHKAKEAHARAALAWAQPHGALDAEAALRGLSVIALCTTIVAEADRTDAALMALEHGRQVALAAIRTATSQQQIDAVLATLG